MNIVENPKIGKILIETVIVLLVTIILFIVFEEYRSILPALPVLYLVIERRLRNRTWSNYIVVKNILKYIKK